VKLSRAAAIVPRSRSEAVARCVESAVGSSTNEVLMVSLS
jgi:hypothetical protein